MMPAIIEIIPNVMMVMFCLLALLCATEMIFSFFEGGK